MAEPENVSDGCCNGDDTMTKLEIFIRTEQIDRISKN